jgi:hypothetical protein
MTGNTQYVQMSRPSRCSQHQTRFKFMGPDVVFLTMTQFFKMTIRPYTQPKVFILGLRSMKMHFNISLASTIARLIYHWTTVVDLRRRVRSRFPPSSLKQLEVVRHKERYNIPSETIQNWMNLFQEGYKLYYRQMVAQLRINNEMCTFHNSFHYLIHLLCVCQLNKASVSQTFKLA